VEATFSGPPKSPQAPSWFLDCSFYGRHFDEKGTLPFWCLLFFSAHFFALGLAEPFLLIGSLLASAGPHFFLGLFFFFQVPRLALSCVFFPFPQRRLRRFFFFGDFLFPPESSDRGGPVFFQSVYKRNDPLSFRFPFHRVFCRPIETFFTTWFLSDVAVVQPRVRRFSPSRGPWRWWFAGFRVAPPPPTESFVLKMESRL